MSNKLYVGGLSRSVTDDDLYSLFSDKGKVVSSRVIRDRDTGQSKGFGFVEMTDRQKGQEAINGLNSKDIDGRTVTVNEARPREPRGGGGGYGGGGGRHH